MSAEFILILLATGLGLGFLSGLLGIGGAVIMTPVQYWLYTSAGMSTDLAIKMSFATTMAVILPTAASGTWQHHRHQAINWRVASFIGISTAIGGFIGAYIGSHLPGTSLKIAFGAVALAIGIRMLLWRIPDVDRPIRESRWLWLGVSLPIGIVTGMLAIGGGIFIIPVLVLILGFRMRYAIANSLAIMLFTSAGAIIGYIVNGLYTPDLPVNTIGYIYWPAFLVLTISSVGMAQLGAIMAHKLTGRVLNYVFIALQFYIALNMLGVFTWLISHF